jgi:hypothetical protein
MKFEELITLGKYAPLVELGRHAGFRFQFFGVRVRVPCGVPAIHCYLFKETMRKLSILRGQSIKWRLTLFSDELPFDVTSVSWSIILNELNIPLSCVTIDGSGGIIEVSSSYTNTQNLKTASNRLVRLQGVTTVNQEAFVLELPLIDIK